MFASKVRLDVGSSGCLVDLASGWDMNRNMRSFEQDLALRKRIGIDTKMPGE